MQWAAPGTQLNAQSHQKVLEASLTLKPKGYGMCLQRSSTSQGQKYRYSSLHQTAARLEDFLKDPPPLESSFPIFLGSCLEKHLGALKHYDRLGHHSESQHIRRRWVNEVTIFGTCSLLMPLITI